jgi:hypothetical protein
VGPSCENRWFAASSPRAPGHLNRRPRGEGKRIAGHARSADRTQNCSRQREPESSGRVAKATMRMRTPVETRSWARVGVGRKIDSDARPSREFQTEKGRQWQDESVAQLSGCKHQGCRVADRFGDRSECK